MKIAIAIITKNRRNIVLKALKQHRKFSTFDQLLIVDDNGDFPLNIELREREMIFYSDTWLGVAGARNKALSLLHTFDYIFVLDDDLFPKAPGWVERFIYASQQCDDKQVLLSVPAPWASVKTHYEHVVAMNKSTATLILFTQPILKTLGGFDEKLGKYGHEDTDFLMRAKEAGLLPLGDYCTIRDCEKYLHVCDISGDFEDLKWPAESALGNAKWDLIAESASNLQKNIQEGNPIFKPFN